MPRPLLLTLCLLTCLAGGTTADDPPPPVDALLEAARARIATHGAVLRGLKPLTGARGPKLDPKDGGWRCPTDASLLERVKAGADGATVGLLNRNRKLLYVLGAAKDGAVTHHGPAKLGPVTREAVLRELQRKTSDSGQQGYYNNRFGRLVLLGPAAGPHLIGIFETETATQMRMLALEAIGELGDKARLADLKRLAADPANQGYLHSLVVGQARLGDDAPARAMLKRLAEVSSDPQNSVAERGRALAQAALVHSRMGRHDKSLECYQEATRLDANNPVAHYNLGCTYALLGRTDDAIKALETAIDKGFDHFEWMRMDGDLQSLRKDPRWKALFKRPRPNKPGAGELPGGEDGGR